MNINWYNAFNTVEAGLWGVVALVILCRPQVDNRRQRSAVVLGGIAFIAFGLTDLLEVGREGRLPQWLWGAKVACGVAIVSARYTWRGWATFRWRDREFLFGLACLLAVGVIIYLQRAIGPPVDARI